VETPYGEIPDRFVAGMRPQDMHDFLARPLSRRGILAGTAAVSAIAAAGPTLWRQTTRSAGSTPIGPQWIGFGPDVTSEMYVAWSCGTAGGTAPTPIAPTVRWGLDATYGATLPAANCGPVPTPGMVSGEPTQNTIYSNLLLSGLTPGTTYHYAVSNDGLTWGPDATFTTAAAGTPNFRFTAFGDQAAHAATTEPMAAVVASLKPAFHLVAGDLAYANTLGGAAPPTMATFHPAQWDAYLAASGPRAAATIPWHPVVGAHETEPLDNFGYAGFVTRFPQAYDSTSGSPVVRAFTYGNVAFLQLDGNDVSAQETANTGYTAGAQTSWLASTLAGFRAPGSGVDFIVVVCNCCTYSSNAEHGSDGGLRDNWGPLFDQYTVDLVISGHVHAYERTNPMRAGQPTRVVSAGGTVDPVTDGTTYICAGGGGNGLYRSWYGRSGGGNAGSTTQPKIWRWSGGDTPTGGTGKPMNLKDTAADFSAYRRAVYSCVMVDVTAPIAPGASTSLLVQTVMPAQTVSSVTNINRLTVIDSVNLVRTAQLPSLLAFL
jgi:Purple acid Phosphatase, N-terminal domain/Calcineurin-like phosphoesterase